MTIRNRTAAFLLALLFLLSLCACGKRDIEAHGAQPDAAEGICEGYLPAEVAAPEELGQIYDITLDGDMIYTAGLLAHEGAPPRSEPVLGCYDIAGGTWRTLPYSPSESAGGIIRGLSARGGVLWAVAEEWTDRGESRFYLLRFTRATDELTVQRPGFEAAGGLDGSGFAGIAALGPDRALLYDGQYSYVIDGECRCLKTLPLEDGDPSCRMEREGQLLARCTRNGQDGFCVFDEGTLCFTEFIPLSAEASGGEFTSAGSDRASRCESENGSLLLCGNDALHRFGLDSKNVERLCPWTDAALRARDLYFPSAVVLETGGGTMYYCCRGNYLMKLSPAQLRSKTVLIFVCPGNRYAYQDAVLRFNNTNPDYKIELVSCDPFTAGGQERFQLELGAGKAPDIIDTALLSGGSTDGGLLADLLPYIDSDPAYSREDFIQPLLDGMLRNGGLYELIPSVTILSLAASPEFYPGREAWTVDYVRAAGGTAPVFSARWSREQLLDFFSLAAAAEFVDWQNGICSFDSELFRQWLSLIKSAEIAADIGEPVLLSPNYCAAAGACPYMDELQGRYVLAGLPGASSPGYFLRLSALPGDNADDISLGIMASSRHKDAAWEFLRLFLLPEYSQDIPLLQSSFEALLESRTGRAALPPEAPGFYEDDAEKLRELVYSSTKFIRGEEPLMEIIKSEAAAYFAGQRGLEETAALIQSRAGIYLAEQAD